jgi:hypothetical protein
MLQHAEYVSNDFDIGTMSKPQLLAWVRNSSRTPSELEQARAHFVEVDRLLAAHANASPALLAELARSKDKITCARVAKSPRTPPEEFISLAGRFPAEVLANPLLNLMLLENPALIDQIPQSDLVAMLKQPNCPRTLLTWATCSRMEQVQLATTMNRRTPASSLARLRQSCHSKVREALVQLDAQIPDGMAESMFRKAVGTRLHSLTPDEATQAWRREVIGLPQFASLSRSARLAVALDDRVGRTLAERANYRSAVRRIKALHRRHSASAPMARADADAAADSSNWRVRRLAATNPATSVPVLERLSSDSNHHVLGGVASNRMTPATVLEKLFSEDQASIRYGLARNPVAPRFMLERLSCDLHFGVRVAVAHNMTTDASLLEFLSGDPRPEVRAAAAQHRNASQSVLRRLAQDKSAIVRRSVAANPCIEMSLLDLLSHDRDPKVRSKLVGHPDLPRRLIEVLAEDSDLAVRISIAMRPHLSDELFEQAIGKLSWPEFLATYEHCELSSDRIALMSSRLESIDPATNPWLAIGLQHATPRVRAACRQHNILFFCGDNPNAVVNSKDDLDVLMSLCPGYVVEPARVSRVAGSTDWLVRAGAARSVGISRRLARNLSLDAHALVAALANSQPQTGSMAAAGIDLTGTSFDKERVVRELIDRLRRNRSFRDPGDKTWGRLCAAADVWIPHTGRDCVLDHFKAGLTEGEWFSMWELLAQDEDHEIRARVASNPLMPSWLLSGLSKDRSSKVRVAVAGNQESNPGVLQSLANDSDPIVRNRAATNPTYLRHVLNDRLRALEAEYDAFRCAYASGSLRPDGEFEFHRLEAEFARRRAELMRGADQQTPLVVTNFPCAPVPFLEQRLRWMKEVLLNSQCQPTCLQRDNIAQGDILRGLILLKCVPSDPIEEDLSQAARCDDWMKRLAAALHPLSTGKIRRVLARDSDPDVAAVARYSSLRVPWIDRLESPV